MTDQDLQEVVVGPLVRVALFEQEDLEIAFSTLTENTEHEAATIDDSTMIDLVAEHMDITPAELHTQVCGPSGEITVSRPETGNIVLRPKTVLG